MTSKYQNRNMPDIRSTLSEWPVRIWAESEFPSFGKNDVLTWLHADFSEYDFVFAPQRPISKASYSYLFGYGNSELYYQREFQKPITIRKEQFTRVVTKRELLNAMIIIHYRQNNEDCYLEFPYVPSTYYLYDPLLNWTLGLEKKFEPMLAEQAHPRPLKLLHESLPMYNYSLAAYRLGEGFDEYQYRVQVHRHKMMPWKKTLDEWLEIPMAKGNFALHSFGYLTECIYSLC